MKIGILGATGWLGQALGQRLISQGLWPAGDLILANRSGPRGYEGQPVRWGSVAEVCTADVIVIAVRPEDFPLEGFGATGKLLISFATVWTLAKLARVAPTARIVRAMPNGAAPEGRSYTPWLGQVGAGDAALVTRILSAMGEVVRLETEDQLDYMAALPGSGMAYPALMAQAMLSHATAFGLPEAVAARAVEGVICGAASGLQGRMGELQAILDVYLGYRGVTAAGIEAAAPGIRTAIHAALDAAYGKAAALGK